MDEKQENQSWQDYEWLAENENLTISIAKNVFQLFKNDCTIPFIARYRKDITGNLSSDRLRAIKEKLEILEAIHKKCESVIKTLKSQKNLTKSLELSLRGSKSLEEIEHIYAPFKPGAKKTLAARAKELGLEPLAEKFLNGQDIFFEFKNLKPSEVKSGIVHILSHIIGHDTETLEFVRRLYLEARDISLQSKLSKSMNGKNAKKLKDFEKFTNYFDFSRSIYTIKPHQTLALNRGENLKILSIKTIIPKRIENQFEKFCNSKWRHLKNKDLFLESIKDSYSRFVEPLLSRMTRNNLKTQAEKSSIQIFENNLKNMLLAPPLKGEKILAIDPGLKNGCKLALISENGSVIATDIIFPKFSNAKNCKSSLKLKKLLEDHNCSIIALGNGKACRETEIWLNELKNIKNISKNVKCIVVDESGASIYSCTEEAKKEFPNLDYNLISAVSLARRVQDPLAELIKIEPKHLGVGMYQHDIKEKELSKALDDVVVECVSFVGVDLNTASECLLRKVAGLNSKLVKLIIEYRNKTQYFKNRNQIKEIKGIGEKIFEQCSGFLRIGPPSKENEHLFYRSKDTNKLDRTWIHPESYEQAYKFMSHCKVDVKNLGTDDFINAVKNFVNNYDFELMAKKLGTTVNIIKLISDALQKPIDLDLRVKENENLFQVNVTSMDHLQVGLKVTGQVLNVTNFGSFIDIGVGENGLIHNSLSKGIILNRGDIVEVEVNGIDLNKKHISLALVCIKSSRSNRNIFE